MNLTSFNRRGLSILTETLSVTSSMLYSETDLGSVRQPPKVTSCQNKIQVSSHLMVHKRDEISRHGLLSSLSFFVDFFNVSDQMKEEEPDSSRVHGSASFSV